MTKEEQILAFIKRRFSQDCNWIDGNCYYFATILKTRFPELDNIAALMKKLGL